MGNELNGYEIKKVDRIARGLYMVTCKSTITGVNSIRFVSIPLEYETDAMESGDVKDICNMISNAALRAAVLNYDDSAKCCEVKVEFSEEENDRIEEWCRKRDISSYALFKGVNLFFSDPANKDCILRLLDEVLLKDAIKAFREDSDR